MHHTQVSQRIRLAKLGPCPICQMDSGFRVKRTNKNGDCTYLVRCTTCGAETKVYKSHYHPAKAWNRGDVFRKAVVE